MLYVAGEIVLWMILAFALGLLVGWFVWGLRQRRTASSPKAAAAPAATGVAAGAAATSAPAAESALESVTVRPRPVEPVVPDPAYPETPPAGTPVVPAVPLAPPVPVAEPQPEPAPAAPAPAEPEPEPAPAPAAPAPAEPAVASASLAALVADEGAPPVRPPAEEPTGEHHLGAPAGREGAEVAGDDLQVVEGIGPRIEQLLHDAGITTVGELAATTPERLRTILDLAGDQFRVHDPTTWPEQASLAAAGRWDDLQAMQARLRGGTEL